MDRAIALYPAILTNTIADIDTVITHEDTVYIPGDSSLFYLTFDSLKLDQWQTLMENENLKVELFKEKNKLPKVKIVEKPKKVPIKIKVPVKMKVPVVVPAKSVIVIDRGFFYWTGFVFWIAILGGLLTLIIRYAIKSKLLRLP